MDANDLATLLGSTYPALVPLIEARPEDVSAVARGIRTARGRARHDSTALNLLALEGAG